MSVTGSPPSPISSTVDFERDGVQHGFLRLPYSRDDSAWGSIMTPICVIKNADGPTALVTGGSHGDEYEGPIALFSFATELDVAAIRGRVIIVPAMNYAAFRAGTRTSPMDKGNLNRAFPGKSDGTFTEKIANYFSGTLLPLADVVVDFHSGGRTLEFVPFAACHFVDNDEQQARLLAAVEAFSAPYSAQLAEIDNVGMFDTLAETMGKTFIFTELGGGGTARAETVKIATRGLRRVLAAAGIMTKGADCLTSAGPTTWLTTANPDSFVFAEHEGLLEPSIDLGALIRKGDLLARIHAVHRTGLPAVDYFAPTSGILMGRHFPSPIKTGDCLAVIGHPK